MAGFYAARDNTMPPLPWPSIAPPFTPEPKIFTNGPIQVQALVAGSLDFAYLGFGALWLPLKGQAKIIAVNVLGESDRVIAIDGITSIEDLRGKRVGVPEGTSGDMLLQLALRRAGMSLDDVEAIKMDPSTIVAAMGAGQIDAAGLWYPLVGVVKEQIDGVTELAGNRDFFPDISFPSVFVARNEMSEDPETIRRMNAVIREANDFRINNLEESVIITAKFLGVDVALLSEESTKATLLSTADLHRLTEDGSINEWFNGLSSLFTSFGRIDGPLDPSEYYLGELFTAAK